MIAPDMGYVQLTEFTVDAGKEVKNAVVALKEKGAKQVVAFVSHLPLTEKGKENLQNEKNIDKILTTNSTANIFKHSKIN